MARLNERHAIGSSGLLARPSCAAIAGARRRAGRDPSPRRLPGDPRRLARRAGHRLRRRRPRQAHAGHSLHGNNDTPSRPVQSTRARCRTWPSSSLDTGSRPSSCGSRLPGRSGDLVTNPTNRSGGAHSTVANITDLRRFVHACSSTRDAPGRHRRPQPGRHLEGVAAHRPRVSSGPSQWRSTVPTTASSTVASPMNFYQLPDRRLRTRHASAWCRLSTPAAGSTMGRHTWRALLVIRPPTLVDSPGRRVPAGDRPGPDGNPTISRAPASRRPRARPDGQARRPRAGSAHLGILASPKPGTPPSTS